MASNNHLALFTAAKNSMAIHQAKCDGVSFAICLRDIGPCLVESIFECETNETPYDRHFAETWARKIAG